MNAFLFILLLMPIPDNDDLLTQRIQAALKSPLNENAEFIPPIDAWLQTLRKERWASTVTIAWLCDVQTEEEFLRIWKLAEHTQLFEMAAVQAAKQRFESFPKVEMERDVAYSNVHPVVERIQRRRREMALDPSTRTIWEWTHARLRQDWRRKFPANPQNDLETWGADTQLQIVAAYGRFVPKPFSPELNSQFARAHTKWWAETRRRQKLDYSDTRRVFDITTKWAATLPNSRVACREVAALLHRIFAQSFQRRTPKADGNDVVSILNDLDTFILTIFPNIERDQIPNTIDNVVAFLDTERAVRKPEWRAWSSDLLALKHYRARMQALRESR